MSWFGFGGGDKKDDSSSSSSSSVTQHSYDSSSSSSGSFSDTNFAPSSGGGMGGGGGSIQEQLQMEQQRAMIQQVMLKLTDMSFEACVPKPGSSLGSSEVNCINAVVGKYLDTSEFIVAKMSQQK